MRDEITFDGACLLLETILRGQCRDEITSDAAGAKNLGAALLRLRGSMRSNVFKAGAARVSLEAVVRHLDRRTGEEGFHVLNDWDGKADRLNEDIIPVDVLNYFVSGIDGDAQPPAKKVYAILLDYYFVYLLALLSLRAWDEGRVEDNLDRVTRLLSDLQGPNGSGHQFAADAETLIFIATSHYEPDEKAYERLLARIKQLSRSRQVSISLVHTAILGSHLRYGFEAQYARDIGAMRSDNAPDYFWLCHALATLMTAYSQMHDERTYGIERDKVVEGILNGMSADPRVFAGRTPACLAVHEAELSRFAALFHIYRDELLAEFEQQRPWSQAYSPLSLAFNFPHNVLKAMVVDALLNAGDRGLTLTDLLTGFPRDERTGAAKQKLAKTLTGFARSKLDTVRGRPAPALIYDANAGRRNFAKTLLAITGQVPAPAR